MNRHIQRPAVVVVGLPHLDSGGGKLGRVERGTGFPVWAATLTVTEPLDRNETSALPVAMSRAVAKIVKQAVEAIVSR